MASACASCCLMKSRDEYYTAPFTVKRNGQPWDMYQKHAFRNYVNPDALIHGNFVDPTNWGYTVSQEREYYGTKYQRWSSGILYEMHGPLVGLGVSSPTWDRSLVYNMALEKFNSRARGGLDIALLLAELKSTARMTGALAKAKNYALSGVGSTKDLANGWLQWKYGWKPLFGDIFGIANESVNIVLANLQKVRARVTLPLEGIGSFKKTVDSLPNVPVKGIGEGKQSCTIVCTLTVPDFDLARWTSLNPVSIAWELIPYSFVADWFFDVGSYLRNLETGLLFGPRFVSGYISELYAYDGRDVVDSDAYMLTDGVTWNYFGPVKGTTRLRQFKRQKLNAYPLPRTPTFKVDLSSDRLITTAALLRQLLR